MFWLVFVVLLVALLIWPELFIAVVLAYIGAKLFMVM